MFLLDSQALLRMLGIASHNAFIDTIGVILLFKIWLLLFLLGYVILRRTQRILSRWKNDERALHYLRQIFVCSQSPRDEDVQIQWNDKLFFRRLLLSQLSLMEGVEAARLIFLYKKIGYWNEDLKALRSRLWWIRLAAIIRLEAIRASELEGVFLRMVEDPNDLVAIVATRAISALNYQGAIDPVLDALSRRAPARRDIFAEILTNFGNARVAELLAYLEQTYDPYLASLCIEVLGNLEATEAIDTILSFTASSDDAVVEAAIVALGKMSDPMVLDKIRLLLDHESERIRAASIRALHLLSDPQLSWAHQKLKADSTLSVRRALFDLRLAS